MHHVMNGNQQILTVSEITRRIKRVLEGGFASVTVEGELSNVRPHTSGHLYFTLKDDSASISGVMWRSRVGTLSFTPQDGLKVVAVGRITVYEPRGNYQLEATSLRPRGAGELQELFEKVKQRLFLEGLFNDDMKIPLPAFPNRVAIVTSPTGAALQDMLNILRRRFPALEVIIAPVKVQGPGAASDIAEAIRFIDGTGCADVMVLARGGGSLEDLWSFNEEIVARAIFGSRTPVVSAIGHEIDYTIADLVADRRAPTPSAAAEIIVKDRAEVLGILRRNLYLIRQVTHGMLKTRREAVRTLLRSYGFSRPLDLLRNMNQRVDECDRRIRMSSRHHFEMLRSRFQASHQRILALDPDLVLKRGYTMTYRAGKLLHSRTEVHPGDAMAVRFHDGSVDVTVSER